MRSASPLIRASNSRRSIEGRPQVPIHNGRLFEDVMARAQLTHHELNAALRGAACASVHDVHSLAVTATEKPKISGTSYYAVWAAFTRSTKLRISSEAPPINPPSISFWERSSGALAGFIEPP
jgi:hypothetical protein